MHESGGNPSRRAYLRGVGWLGLGGAVTGRAGAVSRPDRDGDRDAERGLEPRALRVEREADPDNLPPVAPGGAVGADEPFAPRFDWRVDAADRGTSQVAYRLLVASDAATLARDRGNVLDTGRVASGENRHTYDGPPLEPETTYHWKVRVWHEDDGDGTVVSEWSEPSTFATAIPDTPGEWGGQWVGAHDDPADGVAAVPKTAKAAPRPEPVYDQQSPLLRTDFTAAKPVASARAHVVTLGYGELYVNGERQGEAVLDPAWTTFHRRALYTTHDVTDALRDGENAVGLWLGRGWHSKSGELIIGYRQGYGQPRALVQLNVEYVDGTTDSVVTDTSWTTAPSPITANDIFDGERYDARLEQAGWATPGFDDGDWAAATRAGPPVPGSQGTSSAARGRPAAPDDPVQYPQRTQPIRILREIEPVSAHDHGDGVVVDLGQNFAGWIELTVEGAAAGEEIVIEHAELLTEDGGLDTSSNVDAEAVDRYVAAGTGTETYEPRFTHHGFRYVKVTGHEVGVGDVTGKVVGTDLPERGAFACSNDDLNDVQEAALWSLRSNAMGVPTDCPQRNERQGWTGDAHMTGRADLYNFEAERFYEKYLRDHADNIGAEGSQSDTIPHVNGSPEDSDPNWAKTQVTLPWFLYVHTGDETILSRHYDAMRAYADYRHRKAPVGLVQPEDVHYADWLAFEGSNKVLVGSFGHYQVLDRMARTAAVLGETDDAETFRSRAETCAESLNTVFLDRENAVYANGTQTEQATMLFEGITPDSAADEVAETLARTVRQEDGGKVRTGFVGTRPLLFALTEYGYADIAYEAVSQPERPGWTYITRNGGTALWEWFGVDSGAGLEPERGARIDRVATLTSRNHRPLALVSEWFYRALAGIEPASPGFERVSIAPEPVADLSWAEGSFDTPRGEVASRWAETDRGFRLDATVPWNTTATVRLPTFGNRIRLREGNRPIYDDRRDGQGQLPGGVEAVARDGDTVEVVTGSGEYAFLVEEV